MNTYPQAVISRTKTLEGRYIHSIIQNGGSYFLIDMPVYEDGVVDCWGNVDLEMLKDKILKGWLSPSVPGVQFKMSLGGIFPKDSINQVGLITQ